MLKKLIVVFLFLAVLFVSCQNINITDDELKAPVYLTANASGTTVNLEWQTATGAISYTVYYKKDSTGVSITDYTDKKEGILPNSTSITGLSSGYTYAFIVLAVGTGGAKSDPSPVATAAISVNLPVPQFSKTAGAYPGTQWIAINNYADFPTGTLIAYTTNGTDPTGISPTIQPNGSIEVTASCTLKVLAYVPGWNMSTYSTAQAAYALVDVHTLCLEDSATTIFRNSGNAVHSFTGTLPKIMHYDGTDYYSAGPGVPQQYLQIWKNGSSLASLDMGAGHTVAVKAITVYGSTIYIAGSDNNNAYYWTCSTGGGTITPNPLSSDGLSCVNAVQVISGKIFLGGYKKNNKGNMQACYWIKGSANKEVGITDVESDYDYEVKGIFSFDGTNVIMCGFYDSGEGTYAYAWQDTDPSSPKTKVITMNYAVGTSLAYSASGNIYVGGYEPDNNRSVVWKLTMPIDTSAVNLAQTYSGFVLRSMTIDSFENVFAAGMFNSGGTTFRFYINDKPYTIATTTASMPSVPSIFIKAQ